MAFTFKHGDRPLAGYTVERGVGRGGFGEVYFAVSDSGKEVALKYLRDNPQTELRGVAHCLNLKSPYLVTLYDVRQNDDGEYFVVMEYVAGPSLRDLLLDAPGGLGTEKAAFFTDGIAKGLRYLHERGIVHRDMKPGNIFYEDGYVKIGDYGLSKFIAPSQHSGQTMSVGTVHYMAPEIGSGSYGPGTDIYALGVMLYEMLLGKVPFQGASMGEVLMKHLTAQPEVDALPEPFPAVIRKALAKDPKDRYQTVDELTAVLLGGGRLRETLSRFDVSTLSAHAERVAARAHARVGAGSSQAPAFGGDANTLTYVQPPGKGSSVTERIGNAVNRVGRATERIGKRLQGQGQVPPDDGEPGDALISVRVGKRKLGAKRTDETPTFPPRSRLVAGLLGVFLGPLGAHRFYLGYKDVGSLQIVLSLVTYGISGIWGLVEGVIILTGGMTDVYGRPMDWRTSRDRLVVVRALWGGLSAVCLLGTLPLILVPLFLNTPGERAFFAREFNRDGIFLATAAPPMAFMWAIACGVAALGSFFVWKAAHGPGFSFWRGTLRPLATVLCGALAMAAIVLSSAYYVDPSVASGLRFEGDGMFASAGMFTRQWQMAVALVVGFFAVAGGIIWQIRGAEPPTPPSQREREAVLTWLCAFGTLAAFVGLLASLGDSGIGRTYRESTVTMVSDGASEFPPLGDGTRIEARGQYTPMAQRAGTPTFDPFHTSGSRVLLVALMLCLALETRYRWARTSRLADGGSST